MKQIKHLDCTLRDGGYYNDWQFPKEVVQNYLYAMEAIGINFVEIGFRFLETNDFKGPWAFSKDEYISRFKIPDGISLVVMINAADLFKYDDASVTLERLMPNGLEVSKVKMVRLACHANHISLMPPVISKLNEMGFDVGLNLMQISEYDIEEIKSLVKVIANTDVKVFYVADSLGAVRPNEVVDIINAVSEEWKGEIGIHAHDNLGLALSNTLAAINSGAVWVDSTVTGMGRGPGNTKTEELVQSIADIYGLKQNLLPLVTIMEEYFLPIKEIKKWGTNIYYYYSGLNRIHPSYTQFLLDDNQMDREATLSALEFLAAQEYRTTFMKKNIRLALGFYPKKYRSEIDTKKLIETEEVLIVATGKSVKNYKEELEEFINNRNITVIVLNTELSLNEALIDYRAISNPLKILGDRKQYRDLNSTIIAPVGGLPEEIKSELKYNRVIDYSLIDMVDAIKYDSSGCELPRALVLPYALCFAFSSNVSKVYLAGIDGYNSGDLRNAETQEIINYFVNQNPTVVLKAITPTTYMIEKDSVYNL